VCWSSMTTRSTGSWRRRLAALGYAVDLTDDARQALSALAERTYDAVLMNCHMPGMDGFAATAELRRLEGPARRTPVIAMTAACSPRTASVAQPPVWTTSPPSRSMRRSSGGRWPDGSGSTLPRRPEERLSPRWRKLPNRSGRLDCREEPVDVAAVGVRRKPCTHRPAVAQTDVPGRLERVEAAARGVDTAACQASCICRGERSCTENRTVGVRRAGWPCRVTLSSAASPSSRCASSSSSYASTADIDAITCSRRVPSPAPGRR
jgi:CheY-like chemotaxis protein